MAKTTKAKVYKKIGQKKDTPPVGDSLRKFYESLLKQNPDSQMAMKWLMERGLLRKKKLMMALITLGMEKLILNP